MIRPTFAALLTFLLMVLVTLVDADEAPPPVVIPPTAVWTTPPDAALDLKGFKLTFQDTFQKLDITPDGGAGPWFAPVHSTFGEAVFVPPGPAGPFLLTDASGSPGAKPYLIIRANKNADGWTSGLMQTVDSKGRGFAQKYGYFEIRAEFPNGPATWPAFWLLTQNGFTDPSAVRGEIDVVEWYGSDPKRMHSAVHLWPASTGGAGGLASPWFVSNIVKLPGMQEGFHRYGVMITPEWVTIYFDGAALAEYPTLDQYRQPMYMVVNLAMHKKDIDQATSPMDMVVDYVRAYSLPR